MIPALLVQTVPSIDTELQSAADFLDRVSGTKVVVVLLLLIGAFVLSRLIVLLLEGLGQRAPRARFFFKMMAPVLRLGIWVVALLVILFGVLEPPVATLVAVLAPVGIALGLGSQELVKNLAGGVLILVDRPYQVGDRVKIDGAYGEIDHVGLLTTKLTTPDDTRVTIPNSLVLTGKAWNANSGNPDCQVVTELFVPHDAHPVEVSQVALEAAYSSPYVLLAKPVVVRVEDHFHDGPYQLVRVKAYVYDHRFERAFQSDITTRAKSEFLRRGMLLRWSRHDDAPSTADLRAKHAAPVSPAS